MTELVIRAIGARNFKSYGPEGQILRLGAEGCMALIGAIGSGKSSLAVDAPLWVLYGRGGPWQSGRSGKGLSGNKLVNRRAGSGDTTRAFVWLQEAGEGEAAWGDHFLVMRSRKRAGEERVIIRRGAEAFANPWNLGSWGEEYGEGDGAVEALIGTDYEGFLREVISNQHSARSWLDLSSSERQAEVARAGGLQPLQEAHQALRKQLKDLRADAQYLEGASSQRTREDASRGLSALEADSARWEAEQAARRAEIAAQLTQAREALVVAEERDRAEAEERQSREKALEETQPDQDALTPYQEAHRLAGANLAKLETIHAALTSRYRSVRDLPVGAPCPTCAQPVSDEALRWELHRIAEEGKQAAAELRQAQEEQRLATEALDGARAWFRETFATWQAQSRELKQYQPEAPGRRQEVALLERQQQALEQAPNPYVELMARARTEALDAASQRAVIEELQGLTREEQHALAILEEIVGPLGLQAQWSAGVLLTMEAEANSWLASLAPDLTLQLHPDKASTTGRKGDMDHVILRRFPSGEVEELALADLSGGERRHVSFALDRGYDRARRGSARCRVSALILDEATFAGLDVAGKAAMAMALGDLGYADVVVVDHDVQLHGRLGRTVEVRRDSGGYSTLTEVSDGDPSGD